jgi:hypothetical protein
MYVKEEAITSKGGAVDHFTVTLLLCILIHKH